MKKKNLLFLLCVVAITLVITLCIKEEFFQSKEYSPENFMIPHKWNEISTIRNLILQDYC